MQSLSAFYRQNMDAIDGEGFLVQLGHARNYYLFCDWYRGILFRRSARCFHWPYSLNFRSSSLGHAQGEGGARRFSTLHSLHFPHDERHGNETTQELAWSGVSWRLEWVERVFLHVGFWGYAEDWGVIYTAFTVLSGTGLSLGSHQGFFSSALAVGGAWMEVKEKGMNGGFSTSICLRPMLGGSEDWALGWTRAKAREEGKEVRYLLVWEVRDENG